MCAGAEPGRYWLSDLEVELHPGERVTLAGSSKLAGSALRMHHGVSHLMRLAGLSLADALVMATRNPARVGRIASRQRGLAPGDRADIIQFRLDEATRTIRIEKTWLAGKLVYSAG